MKTDALYLNLFETVPALALRLAGYDMLPEAAAYTCQSLELKKAFRVDIVLTPPDTSLPLVLAEVQFQRGADIYHRLVASYAIVRIQQPEYGDVCMMLLFASRGVDTGAGEWQVLVESGLIRVVYLDEATAAMIEEGSLQAEEQASLLLARVTVSPQDRAQDDALAREFGQVIVPMQGKQLYKDFRDFFVNLYLEKYNTITLEEILAMISSVEIFDDIGKSVAVQQYAQGYAEQYAQELVEKSKHDMMHETVLAFLAAGSSPEYIASVLHLQLEYVREIAAAGGL
jgi:predicted transposase YdaD